MADNGEQWRTMALSAKQRLTAITLSQGKTQAQAAAAVGAGLRTVQRWVTQPEFQEAVRQAQRESYDQAIAKLVACSAGAVAVLAAVAGDSKVSASARVAASRAILDAAYRGYAQEELARRVEELEQRLQS